MKKILLIIAVMLSISSIAQDRRQVLKTRFAEADSVFFAKLDSVSLNHVIYQIEADTSTITMTVEQCLLLYFNGYINGSLKYKKKGSFDFDGLSKDILFNKKSIYGHINRIKNQN